MNIPLERTSLLASGTYKFRIIKVEVVTETPSGFPRISLTLDVMTEEGRPLDRQMFDSISLSPKARFRVDDFLNAIGAGKEGSLDSKQLRGKTFKGIVGKQTYKGRESNIVDGYIAFDPEDGDPPSFDSTSNDDEEYDYDANQPPKGFNPLEDEDDEESESKIPEDSTDEDIPF